MYGTLNNGLLSAAPNPLETGGNMVFNPTNEQYTAAGYMPVTFTSAPAQADGEKPVVYYVSGWEIQNNAIVQTWTATDIPTVEETTPTLEQRVENLEETVDTMLTGGETA